MNKLMGFFELKETGLPAVKWEIFNEQVTLSDDRLWTIRTAINKGNDFNLPRLVGADAKSAYNTALELYHKYKNEGMIIYYPFFIAEKSGVMEISNSKIVIEAVSNDLWNLVTDGKKDVTITINNDSNEFIGNEEFLSLDEINELTKHVKLIRRIYRDMLLEGKSILVEWSFAYDSNLNKLKVGERYLVFYELRSI